MFWYCYKIIWKILVLIFKRNNSAFGKNLGNSSLQGLLGFLSLSSLFHHSFLHLLRSLELFDNDKLVSELHELMSVFIQAFFRESYMHLTAHPFQIKEFVSYCSIFVKHLVEFSQFEKDNFVKVLAFYPPILLHSFCKSFLCFWRNEQCWRIILGMIRSSSS